LGTNQVTNLPETFIDFLKPFFVVIAVVLIKRGWKRISIRERVGVDRVFFCGLADGETAVKLDADESKICGDG